MIAHMQNMPQARFFLQNFQAKLYPCILHDQSILAKKDQSSLKEHDNNKQCAKRFRIGWEETQSSHSKENQRNKNISMPLLNNNRFQYTINDNFIIVLKQQLSMGLTISQSKVQSMRKEKSSARKNNGSDRYDISGIDMQESRQIYLKDIEKKPSFVKNDEQQEKEKMLGSKQKGLSTSKKSLKQGGMYTRNTSQLVPSIVVNQPRRSPKNEIKQTKNEAVDEINALNKEEKQPKTFNRDLRQQKQQNNLKQSSFRKQANSVENSREKSKDSKQQSSLKKSSYREQANSFQNSKEKSKDSKQQSNLKKSSYREQANSFQNTKNQQKNQKNKPLTLKNTRQLDEDKRDDEQSLFDIDEKYDLYNSRIPKKNQSSLQSRQTKIPQEKQSNYQTKYTKQKPKQNINQDSQEYSQFQQAYSKYDWTIPKLYQQSQGSAKSKLKPSPSNLILAKSRKLQVEEAADQEKKGLNWNNRRQIMTQIALDRLKTADRFPFLNVCISEQKKNEILQNFCS